MIDNRTKRQEALWDSIWKYTPPLREYVATNTETESDQSRGLPNPRTCRERKSC